MICTFSFRLRNTKDHEIILSRSRINQQKVENEQVQNNKRMEPAMRFCNYRKNYSGYSTRR
jgi:hypothetical protein